MGKKTRAQRRHNTCSETSTNHAGCQEVGEVVAEVSASSDFDVSSGHISPNMGIAKKDNSNSSDVIGSVVSGNIATHSCDASLPKRIKVLEKWLPEVEKVAQSLFVSTPCPTVFPLYGCNECYIDSNRLWDEPDFDETVRAMIQALPHVAKKKSSENGSDIVFSLYRSALDFIMVVFPFAKRCGGMDELIESSSSKIRAELAAKFILRSDGRSMADLLWSAKSAFGNMFHGLQIVHMSIDELLPFYHPSGSCWSCGATPPKLMLCLKCKFALYCNRDCQKKHWRQHKPSCVDSAEEGVTGMRNEYAAQAKMLGLPFP